LLLLSGILVTMALLQQRYLLETDAEQFLSAMAHMKSRELGGWVQQQRSDAREIARNPFNLTRLYRLFHQDLSGEERGTITRELRESFRSQQRNRSEIAEIGAMTLSGNVLVSTEMSGREINFPRDSVIEGVLADPGVHYTLDIQQDPASGVRYMVFAEGLQSSEFANEAGDTVFGILYIVVRLRDQFDPLVATVRDLGESGEFLLVREVDGRVQILNPLRFNINAAFSIIPLTPEEAAVHPGILSATGNSGTMIRNDYRAVPVIVAYHHIPNTPWGVIAKQDIAEIRAPLRSSLVSMLLPLSGGLLLTLFFAGLLNNEVRSPLRQLSSLLGSWRRYGWSEPPDWPHSPIVEVESLINDVKFLQRNGLSFSEQTGQLSHFITMVSKAEDLEQELPRILPLLQDLFRAEYVSLLIFGEQDQPIDVCYRQNGRDFAQMDAGDCWIDTAVLAALHKERILFFADLAQDRNLAGERMAADGFVSRAMIALSPGTGNRGLLDLAWRTGQDPPAFDNALAELTTAVLSRRLQFDQTFQQLRQRISGQQTVLQLTQTLRAGRTVSTLAELLITEALKCARADYGRLFLLDEKGRTGQIIASNNDRTMAAQTEISLSQIKELLANGEPIQESESKRGTVLLLPLKMHEHEIGCLLIARSQNQPFDQLDQDLLDVVADIGSIALFRVSRRETLERDFAQRDLELEAANQRLAEANARLRQLDKLKSQFVSDVSHELRTPITNLRLYLNLLSRDPAPEKQRQYQSVLRYQAERLEQLVDDILDLSRLELGGRRVQFAPVDLNPIVENAVNIYKLQAADKGLQLHFAPGMQLPLILGERNQLAQVLTNLIANAINYTMTGKIGLETFVEGGTAVCLQINDTGIGIAESDLPFVFDRFYRGNHGDINVAGSGLGLGIVKEIVDIHQGQVVINSELGVGTQIKICFPVI
jgi:signal transduction histidine kinase